jgi:putative salt-induced outer membrane protein YdiY
LKLKTYGVCLLVAALGGLAAAPASAGRTTRDQADAAEIDRLESTLVEALHARDRQRLESLLAADYVLRGAPDIDRETWLKNATTFCWGDRSDLDRLRARRYEGVVIASFELTFYVDPTTCRAAVLRSLVTDVWVREPGGWKLKIRHAGAAPTSPQDIAAQFGVVPEPPPTWEASSEFSAVATGGNTSTRSLGLGAQLAHRVDRQSTEVSTRFLTSQAGDVTNARALTVQGRQGFSVTDRLQMFGEASYARDRFAGIDGRLTAVAGMAYAVAVPRTHTLVLEGGLGWTGEQRLDLASPQFATATGALDYRWVIAPGTELREEAKFDADLESVDNWRTANTTALSISLMSVLSLRASLAIEYRHTPVTGFGRTDMRTAVALVFSLTQRPGR